MHKRLFRMYAFALALTTAGAVLILEWASLAFRGVGLTATHAAFLFLALGAVNLVSFPAARSRMHASGLALALSRLWILGSLLTLMTGSALACTFALLLAADWLFVLPAPRETVLSVVGGAVVSVGFAVGLWGSIVGNRRVRVDTLMLSLKNLPAQTRRLDIAHITDLHVGPLLRGPRLSEFVERINRLDTDLVVITGDIFDFDPRYIEEGCRELAKLRARHGVYAVLGNHDHYTGTEAVVAGLREQTAIRLLRDEWARIDIPGGQFVIAGLEDPEDGWMDKQSEHAELDRLAAEIPEDLPSLLLVHRPSFFHHAEELGFPLVLAGHTHGGQIALPFATHANMARMISERTRGLFRRGDSQMYVNRGLGMAGLPMRLNCPREITLIQLSP